MDETNGRDGESFHRNEAISAVADEAFLGEEDDDDYEDLYNDVNVGDGFLQSVKKNESLPDPEPENVPKVVESVPESVSDRTRKFENDGNEDNEGLGQVVASEGVALENVANKGELGQFSVKVNEPENRNMSNMNNMNSNDNGLGNVGPGPQQNYHNPGNVGGGLGGGGTVLFVGDLHWWTTDAELESELCKYGHVKEVKFFDEKASGKSKGYCQVEFYDSSAATACKEGMNGHVFNGRPCVVAFASPFSVKRMGEAQVNRTQTAQPGQMKRGPGGPGDGPVKPGVMAPGGGGNNMNMAPGDNNRGYGRANWGRNNGNGMGIRGGGRMGGRARPMMGNNGNGYGPPPMMHPQSMMGQGFDPSFNGPMNRMGNYGFPGGPTPPYPGMMPSFPPVGNVGLPGLAPHVNPAFFGRGMPMNGMGMMQQPGGPDGPNMGMWPDPNMPGWAGDEHGGRVGESSYGEEAGSDQQYGDVKEKERERDWSGTSDRRVRDERDVPREKETAHEEEWPAKRHRERERDRDRERERERSRDRDRDRDRERSRDHHRHREEKDRYGDHHRHRDAEPEYDEEWDRSRSSRTHAKSRTTSHKDERRSRSKDADYGKRRRVTAE